MKWMQKSSSPTTIYHLTMFSVPDDKDYAVDLARRTK
jgi:hypothetical protein